MQLLWKMVLIYISDAPPVYWCLKLNQEIKWKSKLYSEIQIKYKPLIPYFLRQKESNTVLSSKDNF